MMGFFEASECLVFGARSFGAEPGLEFRFFVGRPQHAKPHARLAQQPDPGRVARRSESLVRRQPALALRQQRHDGRRRFLD